MKKTIKTKATASRKSTLTANKKAASRKSTQASKKNAPPPEANPARPGGKLGLTLDRLSTQTGATADELVEATGWQRNSTLGALSKLRSRGFKFNLDAHADRKAYRLTELKG